MATHSGEPASQDDRGADSGEFDTTLSKKAIRTKRTKLRNVLNYFRSNIGAVILEATSASLILEATSASLILEATSASLFLEATSAPSF